MTFPIAAFQIVHGVVTGHCSKLPKLDHHIVARPLSVGAIMITSSMFAIFVLVFQHKRDSGDSMT
jgi:hypothetical protein